MLPILQAGVRRIHSTACRALPPESTPHDNFRLHSHRQREILFVLEGESDYILDSHWYRLRPGDAVFVEPWQSHGCFYREDENNLKHLWFILHSKFLSGCYNNVGLAGQVQREWLYGTVSGPAHQMLLNNWDRARTAKAEDCPWYAEQLRRSFELALGEMATNILQSGGNPLRRKRDDVAEFMADYIDRHLGRDCSLARLEKITGYTRCYLSHLFREYYGKTIGSAVNEARMRYILEQNWQSSAKDIADELGFASVATYWKWRRNNRKLETVIGERVSPAVPTERAES